MKKFTRKTKAALLALLLVLSLLVATSCAKGGAAMDKAEISNDFGGVISPEYSDKNDVVVEGENRKIIKNVNESVQTDEFDEFMDSLYAAIDEVGGYVSSSSWGGNSYYNDASLRSANITVRIPAQSLSAFTSRVESLAVVTSYDEYINDVTGQYVDVTSRIAVLEAEESALLEILKSATTTSDALAVRTRLLDVQSDLASLRAQRDNIDDKVEYSTVTLRVREVRRAVAQNVGFFDEVGGNFLDSVYDIGEGLRAFAVWLLGDILYILIVGAALTGAFFLLRLIYRKHGRRLSRKSRKAQTSSPATPTDEKPES